MEDKKDLEPYLQIFDMIDLKTFWKKHILYSEVSQKILGNASRLSKKKKNWENVPRDLPRYDLGMLRESPDASQRLARESLECSETS